MLIRFFWLAIVLAVPLSAAGAEQSRMSLAFSWAGTVACARDAVSPALTLTNVPTGTYTLSATLVGQTGRTLGEGVVSFTGTGIASGAIKTRAPCAASTYTWIVEARDQSGAVLAVADRAEHFPD